MYLQAIVRCQKVNSTLDSLYIIHMIIRMAIMVVLLVRVRNYFLSYTMLISLVKVMGNQNGKR